MITLFLKHEQAEVVNAALHEYLKLGRKREIAIELSNNISKLLIQDSADLYKVGCHYKCIIPGSFFHGWEFECVNVSCLNIHMKDLKNGAVFVFSKNTDKPQFELLSVL